MKQVCRDPATASARKVSARKEALARSKEKKAIQERYKKSVTIQRNKDAFMDSTWQVWPLTHFYYVCILFQNRRCVWSFSINDLGSITFCKKRKMLISGHFEKNSSKFNTPDFFFLNTIKNENIKLKPNFTQIFRIN